MWLVIRGFKPLILALLAVGDLASPLPSFSGGFFSFGGEGLVLGICKLGRSCRFAAGRVRSLFYVLSYLGQWLLMAPLTT